ncbi:hypothetical protein CA51_31020 [Rosistilla oblonga]|nr:hypothetical protein CA51_31020 [Rosistilla oblonga]
MIEAMHAGTCLSPFGCFWLFLPVGWGQPPNNLGNAYQNVPVPKWDPQMGKRGDCLRRGRSERNPWCGLRATSHAVSTTSHALSIDIDVGTRNC